MGVGNLFMFHDTYEIRFTEMGRFSASTLATFNWLTSSARVSTTNDVLLLCVGLWRQAGRQALLLPLFAGSIDSATRIKFERVCLFFVRSIAFWLSFETLNLFSSLLFSLSSPLLFSLFALLRSLRHPLSPSPPCSRQQPTPQSTLAGIILLL